VERTGGIGKGIREGREYDMIVEEGREGRGGEQTVLNFIITSQGATTPQVCFIYIGSYGDPEQAIPTLIEFPAVVTLYPHNGIPGLNKNVRNCVIYLQGRLTL